MLNIKLEEKSHKMSLKALPLEIQWSKCQQRGHNVPPPGEQIGLKKQQFSVGRIGSVSLISLADQEMLDNFFSIWSHDCWPSGICMYVCMYACKICLMLVKKRNSLQNLVFMILI